MAWAAVCSTAVVLLLLIYCLMYFPSFAVVLCLSLFWYALLCVLSSFAIIFKRKKEPVALLLLSYKCLATVNVLWLFLTVPLVGLQYVIVVHCISRSCSLIFGTVIPVNMIIYFISYLSYQLIAARCLINVVYLMACCLYQVMMTLRHNR